MKPLKVYEMFEEFKVKCHLLCFMLEAKCKGKYYNKDGLMKMTRCNKRNCKRLRKK